MVIDELTNKIRESIYKKSIIIAIITALVLIGLNALYILLDHPFELEDCIPEIAIILGGIGVLLFSLIFKDENPSYYKDASKYFLGVSLIGFAIYIVVRLGKLHQMSYIELFNKLFLFEALSLFYFTYQFKKKNLYFNQEIISEGNQLYYRLVFKNILKLLFLTAIAFLLSFVIGIAVYVNSNELIIVLIFIFLSFIVTFFSASIIYLFLSIVDKVSYKEETEELLIKKNYSKATLLVGIAFILLLLFGRVISVVLEITLDIAYVVEIDLYKVSSFFSYVSIYNNFFLIALFGCLVSYLLVQTRHNKNVVIGIRVVAVTTILKYVMIFVSLFITSIALHNKLGVNLSFLTYYIRPFLNFSVSTVHIIGILYILLHLAYEKKFNLAVIIIPCVNIFLVFLGFIIELTSQSIFFNRLINFFSMLANIGYVVLFVVIKNKKSKKSELDITLKE